MAGRGGERVVAAQDTEDGGTDLVERLAQDRLVPVGADPVEHHATDPYAGAEGTEPVYQRGDRAALCRGVDDEQYRRVEQGGDVGGRTGVGRAPPVVQAHHALDDGEVR